MTDNTLTKLDNHALTAPFQLNEVKFKPQSVKGNRALALAYIDCRVIQDRLDEVLGVENWMDEYEILTDGSVMCRLKLRLNGEWVIKTDVGSPSEQPDSGDRLKAAFSDALKRAAVKFGIGRYLYRLPAVWCDYDPQKRQFSSAPSLPAWAVPKPKQASPTGVPSLAVRPEPKPAGPKLPGNGEELHRRLQEYDAKLASEKKCGRGALLSHVSQAGVKAGYGDDITRWTGPAIQFAVDTVKTFEASLKPLSEHQQAA
ncbi:MAG: Rad52/Rad22 family DNA repair protein [Fimbriiglobus sp.]|nr:Rad52/Rad22 family DNA repair protein [Fimbriiglobus sp.]